MSKRSAYLFVAMGVVGFFAAFFSVGLSLTNSLNLSLINDTNYDEEAIKEAISRTYKISFPMQLEERRNLPMFLPVYSVTDEESASVCAKLFGVFDKETETDDFFRFEGGGEILDVYKYMSRIRYRYLDHQPSHVTVDSDEATAIAEYFIKDRLLPFEFSEVHVNSDDSGHLISFIRNLQDIPNHAFATTVRLSTDGVVTELDYYNFVYESFTQSPIKQMESAMLELPLDFPENTKIDLKSCELVYFFENSIVQPGYIFVGEIVGENKSFACYVKAPVYY